MQLPEAPTVSTVRPWRFARQGGTGQCDVRDCHTFRRRRHTASRPKEPSSCGSVRLLPQAGSETRRGGCWSLQWHPASAPRCERATVPVAVAVGVPGCSHAVSDIPLSRRWVLARCWRTKPPSRASVALVRYRQSRRLPEHYRGLHCPLCTPAPAASRPRDSPHTCSLALSLQPGALPVAALCRSWRAQPAAAPAATCSTAPLWRRVRTGGASPSAAARLSTGCCCTTTTSTGESMWSRC